MKASPGKRTAFEPVVLLLQGGGALGSYQGGVYQALAEADLHPDWVAGISIGAFNAAIIAGNPPERRVERLREFWETVSKSPLGFYSQALSLTDDFTHEAINQMRAWHIVMFGAPNFFVPRLPATLLFPGHASKASFYDKRRSGIRWCGSSISTASTVARRASASARSTCCSGNFIYFEPGSEPIGVEHIMASGSLPPAFPVTEVGGSYYWDGGLVSNTPLQWVLDSAPRRDTLAFQVDLWSARGELPKDLIDVEVRHKEIVYSSRTRAATDHYKHVQRLRNALATLSVPHDKKVSRHARA